MDVHPLAAGKNGFGIDLRLRAQTLRRLFFKEHYLFYHTTSVLCNGESIVNALGGEKIFVIVPSLTKEERVIMQKTVRKSGVGESAVLRELQVVKLQQKRIR
ncbi:MAG: hypothetical protein V8S89_00130 [Oscillospiraceae bacterium]